MFQNIKDSILKYVFNISAQPVLFGDLMQANRLFNDGMNLKGLNLGYRLRLGRTYIVFLLIAHLVIIPLAFIIHALFATADCHLSIITAVVFTAILFAFMGMFKEWLFDSISESRIKNAWKLHFPHFDYEENKEIISEIYKEALDQDIAKKDLERFILDKLIQSN